MPSRTREQIEAALDSGSLQTLMNHGKWWSLRRNGKTRTWKTRPDDFHIPVKFGLRGYGIVDNMNKDGDHLRIIEKGADSV